MGGSATQSITKAATGDPHTNHPIAEFAGQHQCTISQLSLAWLLHRSPVICPIPGTSSIPHLEENVAAASLRISSGAWERFELIVDTLAS
jgi:aryl-alcohol dehydrogenase-like predicted oxidoreductase